MKNASVKDLERVLIDLLGQLENAFRQGKGLYGPMRRKGSFQFEGMLMEMLAGILATARQPTSQAVNGTHAQPQGSDQSSEPK